MVGRLTIVSGLTYDYPYADTDVSQVGLYHRRSIGEVLSVVATTYQGLLEDTKLFDHRHWGPPYSSKNL
jgi:hypothetical protein